MISSCSRWMVATMSPIWPVRARPSAASRAPGPPKVDGAVERARRPSRPRPCARPRAGTGLVRPSEVLVLVARPPCGPAPPGAGGGPGPGGRARSPGRRARPPAPASRRPAARGRRRTRPAGRCGRTRRPGAVLVGDAVDPPEAQRLVADVELGQAGEAGPHDDVPLGAGLEGAAPAEVEHRLEHPAGRRPAWRRGPSWARSRNRCSSSSSRSVANLSPFLSRPVRRGNQGILGPGGGSPGRWSGCPAGLR